MSSASLRAIGLLASGLLLSSCKPATANDARAEAVIARTKAPTGDYSLFLWTVMNADNDSRVDGWTAEFHKGALHRVETPWDRVVADCKAMSGTHIHLPTGKVETGRAVANSACGIDTNHVTGSKYIGTVSSGYGKLDIVALGSAADRTYWVDPTGILVRAEFTEAGKPEAWVLRNWAVHIDRSAPVAEMFTRESLSKSFVPEKFQVETPPDFSVGFDHK